MRPSFATLFPHRGSQFNLNNVLATAGGVGLHQNTKNVSLTPDLNTGALTVEPCPIGQGDSGMWVCYVPTKATYGIASGGQTWAASGPFSGCEIVLGTANGQVFLTHIAKESGSDASDTWRNRNWNNVVIWGQWKVAIPSDTFFSASHVFVDWSAGLGPNAVKIVRIDVNTGNQMGGSSGKIFEVVNLGN